ncbi:Protein Syd [Vibrio stylophorae]|uniref:Protein Syd n=1 Tax=Vibrio stylophorae TaxID=659351 RepID=A0ABN8DW38_9VIBR|nr:SecY-interacting protein [Vibrio stylophorae]CAH0534247.1 Protein Syd [Vibrio stylophorae]
MSYSVSEALLALTERYQQAWQSQHNSQPQSEHYLGLESPCVVQALEHTVIWQAQPCAERDFSKSEAAIELNFDDSVKAFYGTQYAGDLTVCWRDPQSGETLPLTLLQVWSDEDWLRLQENLLSHLVMQRQRRLSPSLFIGSLDSEIEIISVCNLTGQVLKEVLGKKQHQILAPDLATFLNGLEPVVADV